MQEILTAFIIGLFVAVVAVNIYFRIKVMKAYNKLARNRVEFEIKDVFNRKKLESEIIPKYPHMKKEILDFSNHIQYSIKMGSVLIVLITAFGAVLMWYRK